MSDASTIQDILDEIYEKYRTVDDGTVATYIPELGKADPSHFGMCVMAVNGRIFSAGDCRQKFTIQSMCKPFAFQMALEEHGLEKLHLHVGVEPSGDAFNAIELDPKTTRPFNPMVNAGAIAVASLIRRAAHGDGIAAFVERMSKAAGNQLTIDEEVRASESATGHRNRAMGHLLLNFGIVDGDVEASLQQYFSQCSLLVDCFDLANMGATLANMGRHPVTGASVFDFRFIKHVLSVMFTCGLYDHAGNWAYDVGLPAKSGVSGGIFGVVNRQLGIAVYSPKLDSHGNSVRGILACRDLATRLGLHAFEFTNAGSSFIQWLL